MSRVGKKDLMWFCQQLAVMYEAGLPIRRILEVLIRGARSPRMRSILREVAADIEQGSTLHQAFERRRGAFSPLFLNLLKAGEDSGSLNEVAREMLRYYEMLQRLVRAFASRIAFPVIEYVAAVAVLTFAFYIITMLGEEKDASQEK